MKCTLILALTAGLLTSCSTTPTETRPPAPVTVTVNPECAEQWMQTAPDGSCIKGTECPVAGQKLTIDGNCVTLAKKLTEN